MMHMIQYHVVPRHGRWHLYLGDSTTALADAISKVEIIKAARAYVRARGGRVIVHLYNPLQAETMSTP